MDDACVSIVMPIFNEKETVSKIINKVLNLDFVNEIIVIDDGSNDGTKDILEGFLQNERIKIIFHKDKLGKGFSLRDGIKEASGEIIATQDGDLEYEPEDLKRLIIPIAEGKSEVVYGSRFLQNRYKGLILYRYGNKFLTFLTNLLYRVNLTDMETGYKVFRSSLIKDINIEFSDFTVEPEITAKLLKKGYKIYEVPISYNPRVKKNGKKIKWFYGFKAVWALIKYRIKE
ncbi:MAG: glycosyltransferase family 2 protein [Candidatus Omnitrophica bacterium]|nr:glycosyltransferase family 2 protein [Candidatus Omnitrophota bacterium]